MTISFSRGPVSEPTKAFLSYDQERLYVAFVCKAVDPSSIRARLARRESIFEDDWVAIHVDPFQERQRAYLFFANPIGIQADGITSESGGDDMSFDAVWSASGPDPAERIAGRQVFVKSSYLLRF